MLFVNLIRCKGFFLDRESDDKLCALSLFAVAGDGSSVQINQILR